MQKSRSPFSNIYFASFVLLGSSLLLCSGCRDDTEKDEGGDSEWEKVQTLYPAEGWDLTDVAVSFRWYSQIILEDDEVTSAKRYQLQVDDSDDFSSPEIDHIQTGPRASYEDDEESFFQWNQIAYMPPKLLSARSYSWRVRVVDEDNKGPWSEAVRFQVNDDHSHATLVREISPSAPLFSFDMFFDSGNEGLLNKIPEIHTRFPASVQPYVAFAIQNETIGMNPELDDGFDGTFTDLLRPFAAADVPILIKTGGPDKDFQQFADLAELEYIFQTQPNVIGLLEGETFWDFIDSEDNSSIYEEHVTWYKRSFQLAAKYGRVVVFGNGNDEDFVWDRFLGQENSSRPWMEPDEIREVAANLIPTAKNNIPFGYYHAESAVMGAWLSGMTENWGVWSEGWAWGSIGYDSLFGEQLAGNPNDPDFSSMPYNLWIQMKLAGLSQGATFFHFGGESSVVEWGEYDSTTGYFEVDEDETLTQSTAFWDMEGNEHPSLQQYIYPFLQAVVERDLIPSKAEVLEQVKIAVTAPAPDSSKGTALDYGVYAPLFRNTIGLDGYISVEDAEDEDEDVDYYEMTPNTCRRELLHNNGRYYMTPILPYSVDSLSDGTTVLQIEGLDSDEAVQDHFDDVYPAISTGTAWVVQVGNRIYINNSHENTDTAQSFSIEIEGWGSFSGTIQPHSYLLATVEDGEIWLLANADTKGNYTDDRSTVLSLSLIVEPSVTTSRGDVDSSWEGGALELHMNHQEGAVEVIIAQ